MARQFVKETWPRLAQFFADGREILPNNLSPRLELVKSDTWQSRLFRLAGLTWSVPVSSGYGRRLRFLVWDDSNGKLIGILALGDPVFNLRPRDGLIGWTSDDREERLVNVLDAYILGAVPPYNMLLGGKLVACLVRTREVRDAFWSRYSYLRSVISGKRKRPSLAMVTATSALGRSSLYNRLVLHGYNYFKPIGYTSGWGHFHVPQTLFALMREYLEDCDDEYAKNNRFGDGPNWRLRAIRRSLSLVGLNPDLLRHGVKREVFACELAANTKNFLAGIDSQPVYNGLLTVAEVSELAKIRWIEPRASRRPEFREWRSDKILDILNPQSRP